MRRVRREAPGLEMRREGKGDARVLRHSQTQPLPLPLSRSAQARHQGGGTSALQGHPQAVRLGLVPVQDQARREPLRQVHGSRQARGWLGDRGAVPGEEPRQPREGPGADPLPRQGQGRRQPRPATPGEWRRGVKFQMKKDSVKGTGKETVVRDTGSTGGSKKGRKEKVTYECSGGKTGIKCGWSDK